MMVSGPTSKKSRFKLGWALVSHSVLHLLPFNFRFLIDWASKTLHLYLIN